MRESSFRGISVLSVGAGGGGRGNPCLGGTHGALDGGMARAARARTSGLPVQAEGRTHSECTEELLKRF